MSSFLDKIEKRHARIARKELHIARGTGASVTQRPFLLNQIFQAWSHVAILRVLSYHTRGVGCRGAARATGLSPQACADAFKRLEAIGIVRRIGPGRRLALASEHPLVRDGLLPLFDLEERLWQEKL